MPADVQLTKLKMKRYLTGLVPQVQFDKYGDLSVRSGSARAFIRVFPHPDGRSTVVDVSATLVRGATLSAELYEHVATSASTVLGTMLVAKDEDGATGSILLHHAQLGEYLEAKELAYVVLSIASYADATDNELATRFGGTVFHP